MWKTSTIITILLISIITIGFVIFDKTQKITKVEEGINDIVTQRVSTEKDRLTAQTEKQIKELKQKVESLEKELIEVKLDKELLLSGGAEVQKRTEIINSSNKHTKNLKLRKGEVYKDQTTNLIIFIKPDFYEDKILVNLTHKNKDTFEDEWSPGKYYYYMEEEKGLLNEIMVTFLDSDKIELECTSYKKKGK